MARLKSSKARLHVVQRLGWNVWEYHNQAQFSRDDEDQGVPVRAFRNRKAAEAFKQRLEAEARRELNPFQFESGELELLSGLDEESFHQSINRLGLEVPTAKRFPYLASDALIDYARWYDAFRETMTDEQREGVWGLLDLLKLYDIVTTDLEG